MAMSAALMPSGGVRNEEPRGRSNEDLLRGAAAGDTLAWDAIVDRYGSLLWAIARGFRLDPACAGDVVQTTWLRLVENLDRIADPERLPGWLATTIRRECLRKIRQVNRERPVDEVPDRQDDAAQDGFTRVAVAERDAALYHAMDLIPARSQRLLRVLMANPQPTYAAVARALDMPIGSIGPARRRALDHLRRATARLDLLVS
jgi:RNA polymerase sigma factor (sigma-70 family)